MRLGVNPIVVSHDRLEDEVIIINAESGTYYSGVGTAADIWSVFVQGSSIADATKLLAAAYAGDEKLIENDVKVSADFLLARGLIESIEVTAVANPTLPESVRNQWIQPQFQEYTDMRELIKLDPIHEVDEVGWPVVKA